MPDFLLCIACLSSDIKMCFIGHTKLSEIYEKLTHSKISKEDRISKTVCYICYTQLQRCCRFMNMATRAGRTLTQLLSDGVQISQETVSAIDKRSTYNYYVATILKPTSYIPSSSYKEFDNTPSNNHFIEDAQVTPPKEEHGYIDEQMTTEEELITIKEEPIHVKIRLTTEEECTPEKEPKSEKVKKVNRKFEDSVIHQIDVSETSAPKAVTKNNDLLMPQTEHKKKNKRKRRPYQKKHPCNTCNKKFSCHAYLIRHSRIHTGERPFVCNNCDKTFNQKNHLIQHMRLHTGEKPYTCHICKNKAFNHRPNYKTHMRKHFGVPSHTCDLCDSAFHQKADLKRHLMSHTGEKPFTCTICNTKFSQNCHLTKHKKLHIEKPFSCITCKLDFAHKSYLNKHLIMHAEKKPFACPYEGCSKSFNGKGTLTNHMKCHKEERPHGCDKCDKTFKQKCNLVKHSMIHENTHHNQTDLQIQQDEPVLYQSDIQLLQDNVLRDHYHMQEYKDEYIIP